MSFSDVARIEAKTNGRLPSVESVFSKKREGETAAFTASVTSRRDTTSARIASVQQKDISTVLNRMLDAFVISADTRSVNTPNGSSPLDPPRDPEKTVIVYDIDALRASFSDVREAFPSHWKHCFAIKSCPLAFIIEEALDANLGIEAASFIELYLGLAHGCPADYMAFDSPAKTREELEMALARGTLVNANSLDELDRIDTILTRQAEAAAAGGAAPPTDPGHVGIRVNPLVGAGKIAELSVSVSASKFAVPATASNINAIVEAFRRWPWLTALHTHVGSQGMSLDQLIKGVTTLCSIADIIDGQLGKGRVKLLDIGGGFPANYDSDEVSPTFSEYASVLKLAAPSLFENTERTVVTEFGKSLVAKTAFTVSTIEYTRNNNTTAEKQPVVSDAQPAHNSSSLPAHQTLVTHMGADLFLRSSYCPGKFSHRISVYDQTKAELLVGGPSVKTDVAGPLCFQGDYVARNLSCPRASQGDFVVAHDTGANTLSLFSRHCSRQAPAVYGYTKDEGGEISIQLIKERETVQDVARFWGAR